MRGHKTARRGASSILGDRYPKGNRWVLFDGDNTLWHIESLYDRARQGLVSYIAPHTADADQIESFQRHEDRRLFAELGYSAKRFATSFENTLRRFIAVPTEAQVQRAIDLALSALEQPAEVDPDAEGVLNFLRENHCLALITAGERWVQERRLAGFRYTNLFDVTRVVERKTATLFRELIAEFNIIAADSWVVGDSLRSDIIPGLEAGLNAILIANHNWIEVEREGVRPNHLNVVDRLGDILPIIAGSALETLGPTRS